MKLFFVVLITFYSIIEISGQPLVKIGNTSISAEEFKLRYESIPMLYKKLKGKNTGLERSMLFTLIAEKLFALEAERLNLDKLPHIQKANSHFEKMFVRDALYLTEIREKAKQRSEQLLDFYLTYGSSIITRVIYSDNEKEINNIFNLLKLGTPFDSLFVELKGQTYDSLVITIGATSDQIEQTLFPIPEGSISPPIKRDSLWAIYKIIKKFDLTLLDTGGLEQEYKRLMKYAKEKAERELLTKFREEFFRNKEVKVNGEIFKYFSRKIKEQLEKKYSGSDYKSDKFFLEQLDLLSLEEFTPLDSLNLVYFSFENLKIKLIDFIDYLRFDPLAVVATHIDTVVAAVNIKTRKMIEHELLAAEGFKRGLDKLPSVQKDIRMWRDNYLFRLLLNKKRDEIDKEFSSSENLITKSNEVLELKVLMIETSSLEFIEYLFNTISKIPSLKNIVEANPELMGEVKLTETDWKNPSVFGISAQNLTELEPGEILGPVSKENGFVVYQLIDKRIVDEGNKQQNNLEIEMAKHEKLLEYTVNLANYYNLEVNYELFDSMKLSNINSIIFRYIGFGGKMTAVPLVSPFSDWRMLWENSKKPQP